VPATQLVQVAAPAADHVPAAQMVHVLVLAPTVAEA
jgi:hypothetical protein